MKAHRRFQTANLPCTISTLLLPITLLYTAVIWLRNRLYDYQILKSRSYPIPLIVVGNLAIGGTGKSPMTEFLIRLLKDKTKLATLSRGYGRKTTGFRFVQLDSLSTEVGDEPLQFKRKFPEITVAVCEDRCQGVSQLKDQHDWILLDDAFQHRRLKPSLSILLFDYQSMCRPIRLLPSGNFRDMMLESRRANMLIITKTPASQNKLDDEKDKIIQKLRQYNQTAAIYFSQINYQPWLDKQGEVVKLDLKQTDVLLVTGIANPKPLIEHLNDQHVHFVHLAYADHHDFSDKDLAHIEAQYQQISNPNKVILTTEKDFQRLYHSPLHRFPFYYIPITIQFHPEDQAAIEDLIWTAK